MSTHDVRERQVNIRLSEEESELLELVSKYYGLNGANLFRMFITREANALRSATPSATGVVKKARKRSRSKRSG
jgi:hypothetical protein